jgi:hypothetical protein
MPGNVSGATGMPFSSTQPVEYDKMICHSSKRHQTVI